MVFGGNSAPSLGTHVSWSLGRSLALTCALLTVACTQETSGTPGAGGRGGASGVGNAAGGPGGASGTGGGAPVVQTCVAPPKDAPPQKLSQTGCVNPSDPKMLANSVVYYEVNSPLWSDGANKERGLALPMGGKIHVKNCSAEPGSCPATRDVADDGRWLLPVGTVLVKSFLFDGKFLETRLLVHHEADTWIGYTYKWDEAQTDATIVVAEGDRVSFATGQRTVDWRYPSRDDCMKCHLKGVGFALGLETAQLNRTVGGTNQIDRLANLGAFDGALVKPYKAPLVAPYPSEVGSPPASATIAERATSYLHANCGFCHRTDDEIDCQYDPCLDLRSGLPLASRNVCNVMPVKGTFDVANAKTVVPGQPDQSILRLRMAQPPDDAQGKHGRMPAIASYVVDQMGVDLITSWITSIPSSCQ